MWRKIFALGSLTILWLTIFPNPVLAIAGINSSVKFRADRKAIIINLSNLNNASSVSYSLTYTTNGIPQGVMGTIRPKSNNERREVLFGTCSKNVCRYHTNIRNAKLVITSKLKSGKTTRKTYILKV